MTKEKYFLSFAAKKVCHEGTEARSRKMRSIFLCDSVSSWLNSIFVKNCSKVFLIETKVI